MGKKKQTKRMSASEVFRTPRAALLSIGDYVRLAAPEPEILRIIGEQSKAKGTDKLTSRQINKIIQATRTEKLKRR
jgi:hypothetical protein